MPGQRRSVLFAPSIAGALRKGSDELEDRALVGFALDPDPAAHDFGEPLADGEAEAGAAILARRRRIDLAEGLEQTIHAIRGDAAARVADLEMERRVVAVLDDRPDGQRHFARRGELHRVAQEIDQDLPQARDVAMNPPRQRGIDLRGELEPFLGGANREQVHRFFDAFHEVERLVLDVESARFDLREIQDVVDEREQRVG